MELQWPPCPHYTHFLEDRLETDNDNDKNTYGTMLTFGKLGKGHMEFLVEFNNCSVNLKLK
jgi:hypothetical protein